MTGWLWFSFSPALWPSPVFTAHVERMTKPCFITHDEQFVVAHVLFLPMSTHYPLESGLVSVPQVSVIRLKVLFVSLKICSWI